MDKPTIETISYYDFNKCTRYIEEKYGINTRDYAGMFKNGEVNCEVEYQDFWHWIMDNKDIHNECFFELLEHDKWNMNDWQKEILQLYIDEFGEEIEFYVWW